MAKLGDYTVIKTGKLDANASSENGKYPFFTCSVQPLKIDTYSYDCECVLVAGNGDLNVKYYNGKFDAYQRTYIIESVDKSVLTVPYMYCFLDKYVETLRQQSIGGVIKYIKLGNLTDADIPLHSVENQNKIVSNLNKVTDLINKRKQQLEKLDELVKSRFLEMFGDVRTNSKGFKAKKGVELFKISNGKAVPNDKRFENGIPAYGGNGISWYTDDVLYEQDTIVIGRVGFQSGNVHLVKGPIWITDNAMYISEFYDDSLSLVFLCEMMEQIDFTKQQDAGDLKKVTQKPFMEMKYILPPKNLQSNYIAFVSQTDKSKQQIQQSLEKLETLKKSLVQEYFG